MGTLSSLSTETYRGFHSVPSYQQVYYFIGASETKHRRLRVDPVTGYTVDLIKSFTLHRGAAPSGGFASTVTLGNVRNAEESVSLSVRYGDGTVLFSPEESLGSMAIGNENKGALVGPLLRKGSDDYIVVEVLAVSGGPGGTIRANFVLEEL